MPPILCRCYAAKQPEFAIGDTLKALLMLFVLLLLPVPGCQRNGDVKAPAPPTNLIWQDPPTAYGLNWAEAKAHCAALSDDGGGWRLPSIWELRSLIRGCEGSGVGGTCGIFDGCLSSSCWKRDACVGCAAGEGPAQGCYWPDEIHGDCGYYWSASAAAGQTHDIWFVNFGAGAVNFGPVHAGISTRCVR